VSAARVAGWPEKTLDVSDNDTIDGGAVRYTALQESVEASHRQPIESAAWQLMEATGNRGQLLDESQQTRCKKRRAIARRLPQQLSSRAKLSRDCDTA
jgi:hypothetical protein